MKKLTIGIVFATFGIAAFAADAEIKSPARPTTGDVKPKLTREEKIKLNRERIAKVGGIIQRKGEGKALVINAQKKFAQELIQNRLDRFTHMLKMNLEVREGTWKFNSSIPADCNIVLYVVDDPSMPMSLYAPESKWSMMNVAKIEGEDRFKKMFARAFTLGFGAGLSQYKASPMQTVVSPDDLDTIKIDEMTVDGVSACARHLGNLGLTQTRVASYKRACEEGWAPSPTNDVQRKVWEEARAIPKNPMKIEFDPKKGR